MGEVGKVNGRTFVDGRGRVCAVGELRVWNVGDLDTSVRLMSSC